jgi:hypothetical protein
MSRSYRKNWVITDTGSYVRYAKNQANRRVRKTLEIPNGKAYKKLYCSYEIHDYKYCTWSPQESVKDYIRYSIASFHSSMSYCSTKNEKDVVGGLIKAVAFYIFKPHRYKNISDIILRFKYKLYRK